MDRAQSMTGSTGGLTRPDAARGPRRILDAVVQAVLGPWPLLPIVSGVLVALVLTYQNMQLAVTSAGTTCQLWCIRPWAAIAPLSLEPGRTPPVDLAIVLLNAIICGVGVGLSLGAFRRWWSPTEGTSLWRGRLRYVVALVVTAVVGGYLRMFALSPLANLSPGPQAVQATARRLLFCLAVVHVIVGLATRRYAAQVQRTDAALEIVQRQQALVLTADERSRREAASFLHDRVQADLLLVALKVRAGLAGATTEAQAELTGAIVDLERIRDQDVRGAGRRLSPDLEAVGIDLALADLAYSWHTAMDVSVDFAAAARTRLLDPTTPDVVLSAIYRICEQALLNAAAHGHARHVSVSCILTQDGVIVTVTDDGDGPGGGPPGTGTAIVDAWCALVGGHWDLSDQDPGARLRAVIPLP